MNLSEPVKKALMGKMSSIYAENATRVGLLTVFPKEGKEHRIVDPSSIKPKMFDSHIGKYNSCQWKINVVLSHSKLNKVLTPEIVLQIEAEGGKKFTLVLNSQ